MRGFHAPGYNELFEYEPLFTLFGLEVTFPTIVMFAVTILVMMFFLRAFSRRQLVPVGSQNVGESMVDFVENQVLLPVLGPDGRGWLPFLTTMFFWVFFNNIMGIIPGIQFPVTSRMAYPAVLAGTIWFIYNLVGIRAQGFFGYFKGILFPPGVPKPVYLLLTPIEFFSTIIVRPITLAVRLFANMVAGHMLLAVLFVATAVFIQSGIGRVMFVLPFAFGVIMTGFEIFVAGMQAFIITILAAVYIAGAAHPEH